MRLRWTEVSTIWVVLGCALLWASGASAERPLERGTYLVQSIAACGNCHTTLGPDGPVPGMELAGSPDFEDLPGMHINTPT